MEMPLDCYVKMWKLHMNCIFVYELSVKDCIKKEVTLQQELGLNKSFLFLSIPNLMLIIVH